MMTDTLPIVVSPDVSPIGIGAVLAHKTPDGSEKVIEYSSETSNKTQRNYSQIEQEALALIKATEHFHQYLAGRKFRLTADPEPMLGIFKRSSKTSQRLPPKLERYKMTLSAYEYDLIHRPVKKHGNVNMLSRFPLPEEATESKETSYVLMLADITRKPISVEKIEEETESDTILKLIKTYIDKGCPNMQNQSSG